MVAGVGAQIYVLKRLDFVYSACLRHDDWGKQCENQQFALTTTPKVS